jgi:hypothetical protein
MKIRTLRLESYMACMALPVQLWERIQAVLFGSAALGGNCLFALKTNCHKLPLKQLDHNPSVPRCRGTT